MINGMVGMMNGLQVFIDPNLPRFKLEQFRFPKTRKKRIIKKWAKLNRNFKQVPHKFAYVMNNNTLIVHPDEFEQIKHMVVRLPAV